MTTAGTLTVHVVKARNLPSADSNGYSDPYCVLVAGRQKHVTKVKKKTLNPLWNESFPIDLSADQLVVQVWDKDVLSKDDFLGQCVIELGGLMLDGSDTWFPIRKENGPPKGELLLQFSVDNLPRPKQSLSRSAGPSHAQTQPRTELPKEAFITGDKMPSGVRNNIKKNLQYFLADQASSPTPFVGPPDGPVATLNLSGLGVTYVPHNVGAVTQLQGLNLGFNKLSNFPQLAPFVCLEVLHLEGNQLTSLSAALGDLTRLRELHLNGNRLVTMPDAIGRLTALEKLSVANNRLSTLPPQVHNLTRLEELNLNGNPMTQGIPREIGGCAALEIMDLSSCQLTNLPDDFTQLTRLMEVNLASNRLVQLPQALGRLTRLVRLDLSDNQLTDLPVSMGYLTSLQTLMIQGNPIRNARLMEKFSIGSDHLVDFLEKRLMEYLAQHPDADLQRLTSAKRSSPAPSRSDTGSTAQQSNRQETHTGQPPQAQTLSVEEKLRLVRKEGLAMLNEVQGKLALMKRSITTTQSLDQALSLAQIVRNMKPGVDQMKTLIPPLPKPAPPLIQKSDDKLTAVKKTLNVAILDLEKMLVAVHNTLQATQDPRLTIQLVKVIKAIMSLFP